MQDFGLFAFATASGEERKKRLENEDEKARLAKTRSSMPFKDTRWEGRLACPCALQPWTREHVSLAGWSGCDAFQSPLSHLSTRRARLLWYLAVWASSRMSGSATRTL
jgi:hypothetical protein